MVYVSLLLGMFSTRPIAVALLHLETFKKPTFLSLPEIQEAFVHSFCVASSISLVVYPSTGSLSLRSTFIITNQIVFNFITNQIIFHIYLWIPFLLLQMSDLISKSVLFVYKYIVTFVKCKVVVEELVNKFISCVCLLDDSLLETCGRQLGAVISSAFWG